MAGKKNNADIGFEKQIWNAACELWTDNVMTV